MLTHRDPAHYLQQLKTTTTPKRLLWLACAAQSDKEHGLWVERWSEGMLGTTHWTSKKGERKDTLKLHTDAWELWQQADEFCKPNRRVVLFCYDLPYQLRVSRGLIHLPALGWQLDKIVLERTAAWALFRDNERTLLLCDLRSWVNCDLQTLTTDLLLTRAIDTSDWLGSDDTGRAMTVEAATIREATLQICEWIDSNDLGQFRPTGSGQSYTAYRRRFLTHKLLVHDDMERLEAERAAMWTGRCEAWRHGRQDDGPYIEFDMRAAYCRIAAECDVPILAARRIRNPHVNGLATWMTNYAVLADMTITTDVPCVPTRHGGRTLWPAGTFRTILWDPEIELVQRYATDIKLHTVWLYHQAPALQQFAQWVLDGMNSIDGSVPPVIRRVLKHWSRCLVGRLGLRYRAWEKFGTQPNADLRLVTYCDTDEGTMTDMLIAGHERLILADMAESPESLPQVPGWVMSGCRRRLWDAMIAGGLSNVVYVDTDSLIMTREGIDRWQIADEYASFGGWARKGSYKRMMIYGPRNLTVESTRRVSGLPLTAKQVAPLEFTGQIMRSIKESMRAGELDSVTSMPRSFVLDAPDLRRQHIANGRTLPFNIQPPAEVSLDDSV